ncbi:hypothetical protein CNR22_21975 [Sphingobacteriaceae bacterium]|nr:hypothetical protein CNR22_21975 [Sphingobacteriaceae bacterium]
MRVLLVANINSSHTKKWALALKHKQVTVALFSINAPTSEDKWYEVLKDVYYPKKPYRNLVSKYIELYLKLRTMIRQFKPDILHSHFITNYSLLANLTGFKRHLVTAWGSDVFLFPTQGFINKQIIKYNLSRAYSIISTSHAMAKEMSLYSNRPICVIPFGIDFSLFRKREHTPLCKDKIIYIGCFKKIENIYAPEILLEAFSLVTKKIPEYKLQLLMAGDGSKLHKMRQLVKDLKIEDKVEFSGWINSEQIPDRLEKIDICVYLSKQESFGVSLIEAMACKIPLVVTPTPGFLEVVADANNAVFVDFNNAQQTAEAITDLVLHPEKYYSMIDRAYKQAYENYQLTSNIDTQISLYNKVLSSK